ncbi:nucleoside triphosphate pyrophosphohydrolase [Streptomyces sp. YIM 130001]|uniref:NUDIX hydrolase n=1 Tax=Streptomyces sp. YIM 130001 TaxID=2259644 RepID=UPI000E657EC8|nr:NUDIX hydrolase [Streptomyces sp. YIM 130001]RII13349.1 nucleoside triphosphate pyrophosphohydrolase [Streptomyces sp. YIM 130001]
MSETRTEPCRDASVIVARDDRDHVALLSAPFPEHGGEYLFLPGGRIETGEDPAACARRELAEEAGVTAQLWRSLGSYVITLGSTSRVHLYEARSLTLGPQNLTESEQDFKLAWWPIHDAITAATQGRFLLPAGPLALLLATRDACP